MVILILDVKWLNVLRELEDYAKLCQLNYCLIKQCCLWYLRNSSSLIPRTKRFNILETELLSRLMKMQTNHWHYSSWFDLYKQLCYSSQRRCWPSGHFGRPFYLRQHLLSEINQIFHVFFLYLKTWEEFDGAKLKFIISTKKTYKSTSAQNFKTTPKLPAKFYHSTGLLIQRFVWSSTMCH